jgi:DNA-binding transcriptional MerR regulator
LAHFSIKDLEQLSGIKAHTIRIWEQRYNIINPKRTESNIRYYDVKDLKHILNISLLNEHGYKISKIAQMSQECICQEVRSIIDRPCNYSDQVQSLTMSMCDLDEVRFEKIISNNTLHHGFEKTMTQIIYPFLIKVGALWQTGATSPAHEHFISCLIRQKLIVAIDGLVYEKNPSSKKFFLFLPDDELHELSLLFAHYLLKSRQHQVIYLGQSLPYEDLHEAYKIHKPEYLLTVLTSSPPQNQVQAYLDKLSNSFKDSQLLISGFQVIGQELKLAPNIKVLYKFEDLLDLVYQLQ